MVYIKVHWRGAFGWGIQWTPDLRTVILLPQDGATWVQWRAYKVYRALRTTYMLSLMTLNNDYQQECMHRTSQGMHVTDYSPGGSGRDPQPPTQRTLRGCVKTLQI